MPVSPRAHQCSEIMGSLWRCSTWSDSHLQTVVFVRFSMDKLWLSASGCQCGWKLFQQVLLGCCIEYPLPQNHPKINDCVNLGNSATKRKKFSFVRDLAKRSCRLVHRLQVWNPTSTARIHPRHEGPSYSQTIDLSLFRPCCTHNQLSFVLGTDFCWCAHIITLQGSMADILDALVQKLSAEKLQMEEAVEAFSEQWTHFLGKARGNQETLPEQAELRELIAEVENQSAEVLHKERTTNLENAARGWTELQECFALLAGGWWKRTGLWRAFLTLPSATVPVCQRSWRSRLRSCSPRLPVSESAIDFWALSVCSSWKRWSRRFCCVCHWKKKHPVSDKETPDAKTEHLPVPNQTCRAVSTEISYFLEHILDLL